MLVPNWTAAGGRRCGASLPAAPETHPSLAPRRRIPWANWALSSPFRSSAPAKRGCLRGGSPSWCCRWGMGPGPRAPAGQFSASQARVCALNSLSSVICVPNKSELREPTYTIADPIKSPARHNEQQTESSFPGALLEDVEQLPAGNGQIDQRRQGKGSDAVGGASNVGRRRRSTNTPATVRKVLSPS